MPKPLPKLPHAKIPGAVGRLHDKVGALALEAPSLATVFNASTPPTGGARQWQKATPAQAGKGGKITPDAKTPWKRGEKPTTALDAANPEDDKRRKMQAAISSFAQVVRVETESQATYDATLQGLTAWVNTFLLSRGYEGTADNVGFVLQDMANHLQGSDVTTNFRADQWFAKPNGSSTYKAMFEKKQSVVDGKRRDVAGATQSGTPNDRDIAETQKMFPNRMAEAQAPVRGKFNLIANAPNRFGRTGGLTPQTVPTANGASEEVFVPNNLSFVGSTRPRYTALNYTRNPGGALESEGAMYGRSVLVWKDDLKRKATFCVGDSFNATVNDKSLCSYDTMAALLSFMTYSVEGVKIFSDIFELIYENRPAPTIPLWYLECHIYEELKFSANLKCVRLHRAEEIGDVRRNIEDFCKRKGVPLIPL